MGVTFDPKMTLKKHLRCVSKAAAQRLGIMYCSAVWCSAADSHLKLMDIVVRSASFLATGVSECNLTHRRSVAVLCMLFKIKSNPLHPLSGALLFPYVPARVTRGALVAHRHSFAALRCRTSQYRRTFVPHSVSLRNDLSDPAGH